MHDSIKNIIGIVAVLTMVSFAYAAWQLVQVYDRSSEPSNFRSFSVQAEGSISAVPDIATFSFSVITEGGTDVAQLQEENADKMNKAIDFIMDEGIDKEDIKTEQYRIDPRYERSNCGISKELEVCPPPAIVGYSIRQSAAVKIRDFEDISALLAGVVKNGANSVSQLQFTIDDRTELEHQARELAIEKAREKAKRIAKSGNFSVGRLLDISEEFARPFARTMIQESVAFDTANLSAVPSVEPGSEEVSIQVFMRYEIQ